MGRLARRSPWRPERLNVTTRRQLALRHVQRACRRFRLREALHVGFGTFAGLRRFVDIRAAPLGLAKQQHLECHAELFQQLSPARAARCEIDAFESFAHRLVPSLCGRDGRS